MFVVNMGLGVENHEIIHFLIDFVCFSLWYCQDFFTQSHKTQCFMLVSDQTKNSQPMSRKRIMAHVCCVSTHNYFSFTWLSPRCGGRVADDHAKGLFLNVFFFLQRGTHTFLTLIITNFSLHSSRCWSVKWLRCKGPLHSCATRTDGHESGPSAMVGSSGGRARPALGQLWHEANAGRWSAGSLAESGLVLLQCCWQDPALCLLALVLCLAPLNFSAIRPRANWCVGGCQRIIRSPLVFI